jgi:ABC-type glycerol-3-phosphate transport system substrate-binding protein
MKYPFLFSMASLDSPSWSGSAETVVKILHIYPVPKVLEISQSAALEYERANPTVKIEFDYLENEEFKAKLPTLLQSNDRPSLFHSWGGGVMREQIQAGVCQDISNVIDGDFRDSFYPAGVHAFIANGKLYGLPDSVGPIVFWYNEELCEKADVDPTRPSGGMTFSQEPTSFRLQNSDEIPNTDQCLILVAFFWCEPSFGAFVGQFLDPTLHLHVGT